MEGFMQGLMTHLAVPPGISHLIVKIVVLMIVLAVWMIVMTRPAY